MRVLIAEDERRLADAIARGLKREGMAVEVAPDGSDSLVKSRVVRYDVVVLDRDLPEVHGDDVCRALREERPETGILMLTAAGALEDVVQGLSLGADLARAPHAAGDHAHRGRRGARRGRRQRGRAAGDGGDRARDSRPLLRAPAEGGLEVRLELPAVPAPPGGVSARTAPPLGATDLR